jgi:phosphate uptake regulator
MLLQTVECKQFNKLEGVSILRIIDMNVEISDDNQRGRIRRKPFNQITKLVEESLSGTSSAIDCNRDSVEASAMDMSAYDFEVRKYWQLYSRACNEALKSWHTPP